MKPFSENGEHRNSRGWELKQIWRPGRGAKEVGREWVSQTFYPPPSVQEFSGAEPDARSRFRDSSVGWRGSRCCISLRLSAFQPFYRYSPAEKIDPCVFGPLEFSVG